MKQYDVYGIGNALVDVEYEVDSGTLDRLGIDKGVMTLVDVESQARVMRELEDRRHRRACGGSAANTIIAVSQFGGTAFYSCKVADDEIGTFYFQDLLRHGIATNLTHENRRRGVTGTCLVFVTPDADRTMNTHLGITADISEGELVPEAIGESRYLYVEGYLVSSETARTAVARARAVAHAQDTRTALTLSDPNIVDHFGDGLLEMIGPGVDLLFANEIEALKIAGAATLDEALPYLGTLARRYVVTRGPEGAIGWDGNDFIEVAPVRVQAVDTVGAGDMFAGAFLYGLTHGMQFAEAGALASAASATLVTRFGPRMETATVQELLGRLAARGEDT